MLRKKEIAEAEAAKKAEQEEGEALSGEGVNKESSGMAPGDTAIKGKSDVGSQGLGTRSDKDRMTKEEGRMFSQREREWE